jgi:hypothetical protein
VQQPERLDECGRLPKSPRVEDARPSRDQFGILVHQLRGELLQQLLWCPLDAPRAVTEPKRHPLPLRAEHADEID